MKSRLFIIGFFITVIVNSKFYSHSQGFISVSVNSKFFTVILRG